LWCKFVVNLWWNRWKSPVAIQASEDVHYLGLELSEFRLFSGWRSSKEDLERNDMLRLTKKADYGLMALKYLAEQTDGSAHSAKDIAEAYHIPPQLLAKILQTLAKAGLLVSHAGTNGGYALSRAATEITAFEVIRAIDGPLFITSCITIHGACDLTSTCTIKEPLRKVNDSIKDLLSGIHIADLIEADGEQGGTGAPVGGGLVSIAV
jgi:Rrf2 family protein